MLGEKSFDELKTLKRELKAWESMFERKHSRKPNKGDVSNASAEIKETYIKYRNVRKRVENNQEFPIEEKDDEVFGKSLNKKKDAGSVNRSMRIQISPAHLKPIKLCHGQRPKKLFLKNLEDQCTTPSGHSEKTEISNLSSSQATGNVENVGNAGFTNDLGFSITSKRQEGLTRPGIMLGKSKVTQRMKRRSTIACDWLKNHKPDLSGTSRDELGMPSNENLFDATSNPQALIPVNDNSGGGEADCNGTNTKNGEALTINSFSTIEKNYSLPKSKVNNLKRSHPAGAEKNSSPLSSPKSNSSDENSWENVIDCEKKLLEAKQNVHFYDNANLHLSTGEPSTRILTPIHVVGDHKTNQKIPKSGSSSFSPGKISSNEIPLDVSATKRKRATSVDENDAEDQINKKRSKIRSHSDENDESLNEEETTHRRPLKRSSSLVSENFRALNMKVRRFSRRGQGTNYAAYKRKMWKQKQQKKEQGEKKTQWKKKKSTTRQRSATSSTTTCFKCGEDGHWIKDCPKNNAQARTNTESWSEPVKPPDLDIGNEEWEAIESKLQSLLTDRLPRPHNTPCSTPPAIEPLYHAENGKPVNTPTEVYDALKKLGFDSFRSGQEEAIMQILCGLSALVVLSTGAGKSLCYQLPAYMYNKRFPCLTVVISPLVSLMEDQVVGLPFGLSGVSLNTNMTKSQRQKAVDKICSGKVAVVLVSPEALVGGSTGSGYLPPVSKLPPIAFACIDEAHCLSEWSHNFRPSYLRVCKVLRERFGVRCFLGLTATATMSTAISVAEHIGITHRPDAIIRGATIPPNLNLSVSCDQNRDRAILELLQGSRFSDCDSIIIYCTRREQTNRLATFLRTCLQKNPLNTSSCITEQDDEEIAQEESKAKKRGGKRKSDPTERRSTKKSASWEAECYHAGMSAAQRRRVQKKFMSGELRIVVATVAFGMGLDKANVRAIIHYNLPKSFESYVQEIGRAGRDGLPSQCHVFIDPEGKDLCELRRHAYASSVDRTSIKKLVTKIFPKCDCRTLEENMNIKREKELAVRMGMRGDVLEKGKSGAGMFDNFEWADDDRVLDDVTKLETSVNLNEGVGLDASGSDWRETGLGCHATINSAMIENETTGNSRRGNVPVSDPADESVIKPEDAETCEKERNATDQRGADSKCTRVCGGHVVALPTDKAVQEMDMKEESIATLLCYLELHENKWVQILQPVRSTCTLKFYGGPTHLHFVAQKVPIVTAAVAYAREREELKPNSSSLTFPVVEIVDKMGWDLEPVRRELYAIQWNDSLRLAEESGLSAGHSGILVEFSDLAFHLRAAGDLTNDERDEICDFLEDRILAQERSQLSQLHRVWSTFNAHAQSNCWQSAEECDKIVDQRLKSIVKAYFESENDPTKTELEVLAEARKNLHFVESSVTSDKSVNWDSIARDIRLFLSLHSDCELSGRAIARIFHGIDSPCFPASVWGRDRRFWRRYLDVDFNLLRKFIIKELVRFR